MPELVVRPQKIKVFGRPGGEVTNNVTFTPLALFISTTKWISAEKNTYVATMESQVAA